MSDDEAPRNSRRSKRIPAGSRSSNRNVAEAPAAGTGSSSGEATTDAAVPSRTVHQPVAPAVATPASSHPPTAAASDHSDYGSRRNNSLSAGNESDDAERDERSLMPAARQATTAFIAGDDGSAGRPPRASRTTTARAPRIATRSRHYPTRTAADGGDAVVPFEGRRGEGQEFIPVSDDRRSRQGPASSSRNSHRHGIDEHSTDGEEHADPPSAGGGFVRVRSVMECLEDEEEAEALRAKQLQRQADAAAVGTTVEVDELTSPIMTTATSHRGARSGFPLAGYPPSTGLEGFSPPEAATDSEGVCSSTVDRTSSSDGGIGASLPSDIRSSASTTPRAGGISPEPTLLLDDSSRRFAVNRAPHPAEVHQPPSNPLHDIVQQLMHSDAGILAIVELDHLLKWQEKYEVHFGPLNEFVEVYPAVLMLHPVTQRVALREAAMFQKARRPTKPGMRPAGVGSGTAGGDDSTNNLDLLQKIGHVSYSRVAFEFDVEELEGRYRRRGFTVSRPADDVVSVRLGAEFTVYLFDHGTAVWWGKHRRDHWLLDEDFLRAAPKRKKPLVGGETTSALTVAGKTSHVPKPNQMRVVQKTSQMKHAGGGTRHVPPVPHSAKLPEARGSSQDQPLSVEDVSAASVLCEDDGVRLPQDVIDALFPVWVTYEIDESAEAMRNPLGSLATSRFAESVAFDHFVIPRGAEQERIQVAVSCALAECARTDHVEYVAKRLSKAVLTNPMSAETSDDDNSTTPSSYVGTSSSRYSLTTIWRWWRPVAPSTSRPVLDADAKAQLHLLSHEMQHIPKGKGDSAVMASGASRNQRPQMEGAAGSAGVQNANLVLTLPVRAVRSIANLAGEVFLCRFFGAEGATDVPDFIWDNPRFLSYFEMTKSQLSVDLRTSWTSDRIHAMLAALNEMSERQNLRDRLRWDVLLISVLLCDALVMLARLVCAIFFRREGDATSHD